MRTDIASSSLRELDAVALATNVTIFMERGTYLRAFTRFPANLPLAKWPIVLGDRTHKTAQTVLASSVK